MAGGAGPRSAHFRPSLLKTFLFPEDFTIVLCFYSGFEADFSYSGFNPLCVSVFSSLFTLSKGWGRLRMLFLESSFKMAIYYL